MRTIRRGLIAAFLVSAAVIVLAVAPLAAIPGVLNPDVTQSSLRTTICVPGFSRSVRPPADYTSRLKVEQMRAYGLTGDPSHYQEDHLISLELGGNPTDPRNRWPEP